MKTILAVDDSAEILKIVESVLKDTYKPILVKSGKKAVDYLEKNPVDLVLLDIMMPDMDGYETYKKIRKSDLNAAVPVIFLTADMDAESELKSLKMGAVDFIKKPFVPEIMKNRIDRILQLEDLNKNLQEMVREKTSQIEQLSFEIISTIASMIEAKDSYTKGHSVRVAEYSAMIAKAVGWKDKDVQNLKYIALLHDIGKVGIPDNVLNKIGKLTDAEFHIIQSHTMLGGDILKEVKSIEDAVCGAKYHHERYDGQGYPCGLAGEHIPEVARIICIADAYDAMNSKRVYRDRLSPEMIRKELMEGRGTQFDPAYLDAFVYLMDEGMLNIDFGEINKQKIFSQESTILIDQIMKNIEEEAKKAESFDHLTGLLGRRVGESKVTQLMKEKPGCLAFVDLDNLKRTNDTMGHLAGDYALKTVGEVLSRYGQNAVISRLGGDEFLYYMVGADKQKAIEVIEQIMDTFDKQREINTYLSVSSLSIGLCMTEPEDILGDVIKKADRALYHVKQSGKNGYYFYDNDTNGTQQGASVDLKKLIVSLKQQGAYDGSLNLEYREFAKVCDYIRHLGERYDYTVQIVMITIESMDQEALYIEEREQVMRCMEKMIQESLRSVDVSTRFSSEQFVVTLMNVQDEYVERITNRIADNFHKVYDKKYVRVHFDIENLSNISKQDAANNAQKE